MSNKLKNRRVAVLLTDGFEQSEFTEPLDTLKKAGAEVTIISPEGGEVTGWQKDKWGDTFSTDKSVGETSADQYDALMLPGGVMNPDAMRQNKKAVSFIKDFIVQKKPIAAICHAPQILSETGLLKGRRLTSYPSIKTDLENAGAEWVDEEVVVDQGLVTSRSPDDLPAFNATMLEEFCEGRHEQRRT